MVTNTCLLAICVWIGLAQSAVLHCSQITKKFTHDQQLAAYVAKNKVDTFSDPSCFSILIDMNYHNSTMQLLNNYLPTDPAQAELDTIKENIRSASTIVIDRIVALADRLLKEKEFLNVYAPTQWAQSLSHVFVEVRFAHRFDAPGCAKIFHKHADITNSSISLTAMCQSMGPKIRYQFDVPVTWGYIDVEGSTHEVEPVGKYKFTLKKMGGQHRWRSLQVDGQEKPQNLRLW